MGFVSNFIQGLGKSDEQPSLPLLSRDARRAFPRTKEGARERMEYLKAVHQESDQRRQASEQRHQELDKQREELRKNNKLVKDTVEFNRRD